MLNKSQYRSKSTLRRPMADVSNEGYDNQARFQRKEANQTVDCKGSLDHLLLVRSDLSDLTSQVDKLVAQALKQKEISKKGYQEIEAFIGFLSGMCSSLKPWFPRLQEALASTTTVISKDQFKKHSTPFPVKTKFTSKTETPHNLTVSQLLTNTKSFTSKKIESHQTPHPHKKPLESLLKSKMNFSQLDLEISPSPLVSWRADHCTVIDGGKQLFILTPLQKLQLEASKPVLPTKQLTIVRGKKLENNVHTTILPDNSTAKKHERHGIPPTESMSKLRFCSTSKTALPTKPLPIQPGTCTSEKDVKYTVPTSEQVHEAGFCSLSKSVLPNKSITKVTNISVDKIQEKHEENGLPITKPIHEPKVINRKKDFSDMLDWFFSPPKTCVLMEPDEKRASEDKRPKELSTPVDKNNRNNDNCEKKLVGTPWNNLNMSATYTKKGEATLKRELWTRFDAISTGDLKLNTDVFQKKDGKGFMDLLDEASS
ncbi:Hemerythrin [Rhynchospora pubera]|uniref:Hemerythrin n=1 Tax=Rhynchospora pubera TaxID=906938 RepID=A0AAV8EHI7_9POAL|nr:Hemerythrin [Rhynchospora pubera]KAJ4780592.1 Hemerythrin [Rhynchospora pubera]